MSPAEALARRAARAYARRWQPFSRLFLVGEGTRWVIDEELRRVGRIARGLGVAVADRWPLTAADRQAVFYGSHFTLFDRFPVDGRNRLATTYFHGLPGTAGMPEFDAAFEGLRRHHHELHRVQVSHRELEDLVLSSGIDPAKVFRIPIAIDLGIFGRPTTADRAAARRELGLPAEAFVVGSFQKDGVGWAEGREPKLIKGPDVLVSALAVLREEVPSLHVLLTGPARGYVRAELERLGIPYVHRNEKRYAGLARLYAALDAYVVTSRQEGGPKAVLESMATGIPLVTTRVGQAVDLVRDGENGWLVDVGDVDAIADRLAAIAAGNAELDAVTATGSETARANSYDAQIPLWQAFFDGFVEMR